MVASLCIWHQAWCHWQGMVLCRLCAAILQSSAWAAAAVSAVQASLQRLQQAMRATKGPWLNR